jgi:hypothetical protein
MYARWGSFAIGMGLILAPLALGYDSVGPILHDIALGLLVCVATVAALEWPAARFALTAPALWLVWTGRASADRAAAIAEIVSGALLLVLALVPSARLASRLGRESERAGARA